MDGDRCRRSLCARTWCAAGAAFALCRLRWREHAWCRLAAKAGVLAACRVAQSCGGFPVTKRLETAERRHAYAACSRRHDGPQHIFGLSRSNHASRVRHSGVVLPIVLLISAMMLATSAVWFETSLAAARAATNVRDYLQAFHAADSALNLCSRSVIAAGSEATAAPPVASGEPTQWKLESAFEAGAIMPIAQWPGSLRAPQCSDRGLASCRSRRCPSLFVDLARLRPDQRVASMAADGIGDRR